MIKRGFRQPKNKVIYETVYFKSNPDFIYKSLNYGPFKIIEDIGKINGIHKFKIQFLDTGYISEVAYNQIKFASVRDATRYPIDDRVEYNTKIYPNKYGDLIILKDIPKKSLNEKKNHHVLIKFIDTGTIKEALLDDIFLGCVKDPLFTGYKIGDIVESKNFGSAEIIELIGYMNNSTKQKFVKIKFIDSGNEKIVRVDKLNDGNFGDYPDIPYHTRIDGGIMGNVSYGDYKLLHKRWSSMRNRCLLKNDMHYRNYGAKGVTIDPFWDIFENFVNTAPLLPGYEKFCMFPSKFHLDKDFKQLSLPIDQRVYSPNTCVWLLDADNIALPEKMYTIISNGGSIQILQNGNFKANLCINGILMEYGEYYSITEIVDRLYWYMKDILIPVENKERKQLIRPINKNI